MHQVRLFFAAGGCLKSEMTLALQQHVTCSALMAVLFRPSSVNTAKLHSPL